MATASSGGESKTPPTSGQGGTKTASRKSTPRKTSTTQSTRARSTGRRSATTSRRSTTTSTQPKTPAEQVQVYARRAMLVPVGAGLEARDNLVSTVTGLVNRYGTRSGFERELKRYERRGATARNRFERQIRRSRTRFERQLRQRRSLIERTIKQNRRRVEHDINAVRRDLGKQSGIVSARVEKLVTDAQGLIGS